MVETTPIDQWQLQRLNIFADRLDALVNACREYSSSDPEPSVSGITGNLDEFRGFSWKVANGDIQTNIDELNRWMKSLEEDETDVIKLMFSLFGDSAIEFIHTKCREEGFRWGSVAGRHRGAASQDARKALLVLNDYLIDGMPGDDNIEILFSEPGRITYTNKHCSYHHRTDDSEQLSWGICSAREAWKDGFFDAIGGVAHQMLSSQCQGDDSCTYVITLTDEPPPGYL
jgi:hypothetical protein